MASSPSSPRPGRARRSRSRCRHEYAGGRAPIRVVVVDDHPVVRDGLRGMLDGQTDLEVVGEAGDGKRLSSVVVREHPDVVLMDLRMPGMDGVTGDQPDRSAPHPGVRVLVLTTYDADHDIVRAVEAGATGVLLKDAPRDELFRAVRAAGRGEMVLAPAVTATAASAGCDPAPARGADRARARGARRSSRAG